MARMSSNVGIPRKNMETDSNRPIGFWTQVQLVT